MQIYQKLNELLVVVITFPVTKKLLQKLISNDSRSATSPPPGSEHKERTNAD